MPHLIRNLAIGTAVVLATAAPALAFKGAGLARLATVSIVQARAIALKACPGRIVDEELEKEAGGSGLRYSFDIRHGAAVREVGVDARSGRVLENSKEGAHPD